jgi:hypothetical protein
MVDYISALVCVILLALIPATGPHIPAHTEIGRGPIPGVGFPGTDRPF